MLLLLVLLTVNSQAGRDVQMPCILMSAALDETIRHEAELMHVFRVIGKPFRLAEISQTVRQGLAEHYGWAG